MHGIALRMCKTGSHQLWNKAEALFLVVSFLFETDRQFGDGIYQQMSRIASRSSSVLFLLKNFGSMIAY